MQHESRVLQVSCSLYTIMLRAYPAAFRRGYGREMALVFHDGARDAVETGGTVALVLFMLHTLRDWATTVTRERLDMDMTQRARLNQASTVGLIVFSATAFAVALRLWYGMATGRVPPPNGDEGAAAHIFQLSIAALLPVGFLFAVTADWTQPVQAVRRVVLPGVIVMLALGTVFYLENVYYAAHGLPAPRPGLPLIVLRRLLAGLRGA
jgi:hypothetical protein